LSLKNNIVKIITWNTKIRKRQMQKILLAVILFSSSIFSQTTFNFLRLDNSPRAAALAGSFVAANDDVNSIFYNPAGINKLKATPVSFSFLKHLEGINSASLIGSRQIKDWGRFSFGVQYVNYGSFTRTDEVGNILGSFSANDLAMTLGYGNQLDNNFYYGVSLKFIYSGIDNYNSTAVATDIGLLYEIPENLWSFGFSVLNLGTQLSTYAGVDEKLPLDVRLGASKRLAHVPLKFYFSLNRLSDSYTNFSDRLKQWTFGAELKISGVVTLRFGYDNNKRQETELGAKKGFAGFNLGFGVNVKGYQVDYAFSSFGPVGNLHRFGLSTRF
jgi:hypothetical protein